MAQSHGAGEQVTFVEIVLSRAKEPRPATGEQEEENEQAPAPIGRVPGGRPNRAGAPRYGKYRQAHDTRGHQRCARGVRIKPGRHHWAKACAVRPPSAKASKTVGR